METVKSGPRDTFLYLLGIITLVVSAVSFGILIYQFIDLRFPDVLQGVYTAGFYDTIRSAVATLVVVFPVFWWTSATLRRDVVKNPAKKEIRARRWLMYLTVFIAGLVVIGDLVALINSYLHGELTASFILKVLTIFFIAGSSLFYYLAELQDRAYPRRAFQWTVIGVVLVAIAAGFYLAGSPQNQRLVRFDEQSISNLQAIQDRIVYFWQQKGALPIQLSDLNDSISGFAVPNNPQNGQAYEYRVTGAHAFQLCAPFNTTSSNQGSNVPTMPVPAGGGVSTNWNHGTGRQCFDRTIDPSLYPVIKK